MKYSVSQLEPFGALVEPVHKYQNISEIDVESLRTLFLTEHLLVLRGFNGFSLTEDFASYCERWGEVSLWPFGKVLDLVEQERPDDHIFDCTYVPLHWDGMYRPQVPEYQIFRCLVAPAAGCGGRTTFSNTVLALQHASREQLKQWQSVTAVYKRKVEFYDSRTTSPIVTRHPFRDFLVIRYNEIHTQERGRLLNPVEHEFQGLEASHLPSFHNGLRLALYDSKNFYAHDWQMNDVVIADNFTLLHGRESFVSKSPRHIQRVQVLSNPPLKNSGLESYV
jgi:alpha-ketoglutarate-dependent taurine dioxygenase